MKSRRLLITLFALGLSLSLHQAKAQTPGVLYTWPSTTSDWYQNFGGGSGTLSNSGGALQIAETSATPGTGAAWSDGFNTIRDTPATFGSGCCELVVELIEEGSDVRGLGGHLGAGRGDDLGCEAETAGNVEAGGGSGDAET